MHSSEFPDGYTGILAGDGNTHSVTSKVATSQCSRLACTVKYKGHLPEYFVRERVFDVEQRLLSQLA